MNAYTCIIKYYINLVYFPAIFIFLFASIIILFCFLSSYHNLNKKVINFIPFVLLLSLYLVIICTNLTTIYQLTLLLFLHCFLCIPLLVLWVKLYRNNNFELAAVQNFYFFETPEIYLQISLAIIYPIVFGIYFSLFRYIRLGQTLDVFTIFLNDYFFLIIFALPHFLLWFVILLHMFKGIFIELWTYTAGLFYAFHLYLLQNSKYFLVFKALHRIHFFISDIILRNYSSTRYSANKFNLLAYLYYRLPYILPCILIVLIFGEILVSKGKLYYSIYLLFFYPIIMFLIKSINSEIFSLFIDDVCKSDYLAKNFTSPRYYQRFYSSFNVLKLFYNFGSLSKSVEETASIVRQKYISLNKRRDNILRRTWGYKLEVIRTPSLKTILVHAYEKKPWNIRFAASYYTLYGVRWFSSSRILLSPNKLHTATALLCNKNPYNILALVGHPGQNFNIIQKVSRKISWPLTKDLYGTNISPNILVSPNSKFLADVLETNLAFNFQTVMHQNVIVGTYKPMIAKYSLQTLFAMQQHPDTVLQFDASKYKFQHLIGIDHKFGGYLNEYGRNQILTVHSLQVYEDILLRYRERLIIKGYFTEDIGVVLQELINSAHDFQMHQQIWAEYLHLFPPRWSPPLYINPMFQEEYLRPETKKFLQEAHEYNLNNSKILYERGVPELSDYSDNGISLFENSFLQGVLGS